MKGFKGFNEFLSSLLPSEIEAGRIKFSPERVESSLKHEDGHIIVQSVLETDCTLDGEVCIPHINQLQKAYKALEYPTIGIHYERDIASRLNLHGDHSKVSLFLMDPEFVTWPKLKKEPDYQVIMELPISALTSLKTNYSLIQSDTTFITLKDGVLTFKIGDEALENSAETSIEVDVQDELSMSYQSSVLTAILDSILPNSTVIIHVSDHGLTKIHVTTRDTDFTLKTNYFLVATQ